MVGKLFRICILSVRITQEIEMDFKDCRERFRKFGAYSGWESIQGAKLMGDIPEQYWDVFADRCECGSENIIAPNLKREMCCDPRCCIKEAYKLAEMFSRFGVLGLGYANCNTVYTSLKKYDKALKDDGNEGLFQYHTYTEVLMVPWEKYPVGIKELSIGWDFFAACHSVRNTPKTFAQLVGSLGLSSLGTNAEKIFDGINSFSELKDEIQKEGSIQRFCAIRGVHSPEIILDIANSLEDIAVAEFACSASLKKSGLNKMSVCITGRVVCNGQSMTKEQFIRNCNNLCIDSNGVPMLEIKNVSGAGTVPFVLYTTPSGTEKYNTGRSRGKTYDEYGEHAVLMTVSEFYNWLKGAMDEWNIQKDFKQTGWNQILSSELKKMTMPEKQETSKQMQIF